MARHSTGHAMTDPMLIGQEDHPLADIFISLVGKIAAPRVIEFGTKRWDPQLITHHHEWALHADPYLRADIGPGQDVDAVVNMETAESDLDRVLGHRSVEHFDAVMAVAVLEHVQHPWLAFQQVYQILKPGGWFYAQTHHTFVEHAFPDDYWRFSRQALELLAMDAGFSSAGTSYTYPCTITPHAKLSRWNEAAEAWLCVDILAHKS